MFVLFCSELSNYLSTRTVERMKVDPTLGERLVINFDITFHALHCAGACLRWRPAATERNFFVCFDSGCPRLPRALAGPRNLNLLHLNSFL